MAQFQVSGALKGCWYLEHFRNVAGDVYYNNLTPVSEWRKLSNSMHLSFRKDRTIHLTKDKMGLYNVLHFWDIQLLNIRLGL